MTIFNASGSRPLAPVLVLLGLVLVTMGCDKEIASSEKFEAIMQEFRQTSNHDMAITQLSEFVVSNPDFFKARFNLGLLLEVKGDWAEAKSHYEYLMAQTSLPDELKRKSAQHLERVEFALSTNEPAKGEENQQYGAKVSEAIVNLDVGRNKEAFRYAQEAIRLDETRYEAFVVAARAAFAGGAYYEAEELLIAAIDLAPEKQRKRLSDELQEYLTRRHVQNDLEIAKRREAQGDFVSAAAIYERVWFRDREDRGVIGLAAALAWSRAGERERSRAILQVLEGDVDPNVAKQATNLLKDNGGSS